MYIDFYRYVIVLASERERQGTGGGVQAADGKFARWKLHPDMEA